ncbi:MAG TPA: MFS transporter [Polyangiaceae bacterium]|jgi:MFS family permease
MARTNERNGGRILFALSLLYAAQGVPYGFASDYMPVALRENHYSLGLIAAVSWLQLPWQLKVIWSTLADRPAVRARSRGILLVLQTLLFVSIALFALRPLKEAPGLWFVLVFFTALFASTQDIFVDALAVRSLPAKHLGFGNTAQVAGYRLGMLAGGAGLLLLSAPLGFRGAVLASGSLVLLATPAARLLREREVDDAAPPSARSRLAAIAFLRHIFSSDAWPVMVIALTYKLGLHMATVLIKPMLVDAHWTHRQIGLAAVTLGITCGLVGAAAGGVLHRLVSETRALAIAGILQAIVCVPLVLSLRLGVPLGWTTVSIATESFVSGLGTTVLFAALMTATRKADAGLHYTLLTSANTVAIGVGGQLGGSLADRIGKGTVLALAAVLCAVPLVLLPRWKRAAAASAS